MEQQPIIIAKNVSGSSQGFLGSVIQPGGESQISDLYFQNEITGSSELRALINSDDIVINNGTDDLTPAQAITLCSYPYSMLNATTSGTDNASVGTSTLESITTGDCNTAVGDNALPTLTTGSDNIAVGTQSGSNYTGNESDNILLGHPGTMGENATIRIGTATQTTAYIEGIHGVTLVGDGSTQKSVIIDSNGQLGSAVSFPRLIDSYVDTTLSTTTSASLRIRMNTTIPILLRGDYSLNINYCWNHNGQQGTRTDFISVITFDGVILGNSPANSLPNTHRQEPKDADGSGGPTGTNQQYSWSKTFILENVTPGSKSLTLQYSSSRAGTTSSIWNIVYILNQIAGPPFSLESTLEASNAGANDYFGYSVAMLGSTILVGAYKEDSEGADAGAAYVYDLEDNVWSETTMLSYSSGSASDWFGYAVALCDTILAGREYSDTYAIVGAMFDDEKGANAGAAVVFIRVAPTVWVETQALYASDAEAGDTFGSSLAADVITCVIGAYSEDTGGSNSGAAYVFTEDDGNWTELEKIVASDPAVNDYFGYAVDISGDYIISGAYGSDTDGSLAGCAYVFKLTDGSFVQQQKLLASDGAASFNFGKTVSISGSYIAVGAPENLTVYIFKNTDDVWSEVKIVQADILYPGELFGRSINLSGDYLIVGDRDSGEPGQVYIFNRNAGGDNNWGQIQKITQADAVNDGFGIGVAIQESTTTAVVGAPYITSGEGRAYVYNRD